MMDGYLLELDFIKQLKKMLAWFKQQSGQPKIAGQSERNLVGVRPPVRFITLKPYSTYIIRQYSASGYGSYDMDGDDRGGQEYLVMVDGETPVPVALQHYEAAGNHKQLITFVGDNINGTIKLILDGQSTSAISLTKSVLTADYLKAKLEELPVLKKNLVVTIYPGRWLIEFTGKLAGKTFDLFEVDRPYDAEFEVLVMETKWNDSNQPAEVIFPIPLAGKWDGDDNVINDAVAAGAIGTAKWFPGTGHVVDACECRDFNGDGTPNL
ncbi:MAG: hypothetical protein ABIK07_14785 [Planctomycetota bacterium]